MEKERYPSPVTPKESTVGASPKLWIPNSEEIKPINKLSLFGLVTETAAAKPRPKFQQCYDLGNKKIMEYFEQGYNLNDMKYTEDVELLMNCTNGCLEEDIGNVADYADYLYHVLVEKPMLCYNVCSSVVVDLMFGLCRYVDRSMSTLNEGLDLRKCLLLFAELIQIYFRGMVLWPVTTETFSLSIHPRIGQELISRTFRSRCVISETRKVVEMARVCNDWKIEDECPRGLLQEGMSPAEKLYQSMYLELPTLVYNLVLLFRMTTSNHEFEFFQNRSESYISALRLGVVQVMSLLTVHFYDNHPLQGYYFMYLLEGQQMIRIINQFFHQNLDRFIGVKNPNQNNLYVTIELFRLSGNLLRTEAMIFKFIKRKGLKVYKNYCLSCNIPLVKYFASQVIGIALPFVNEKWLSRNGSVVSTVYLYQSHSNVISANQIQSLLGITEKKALEMLHYCVSRIESFHEYHYGDFIAYHAQKDILRVQLPDESLPISRVYLMARKIQQEERRYSD